MFCRDTAEDQPFETPGLVETYLELFNRSAAASKKPHYLLHTRPGSMDRTIAAQLRAHGIPIVGGLREGLTAIDRLARLASRSNLAHDPFRFDHSLPRHPRA